jgi:hypothetical protein
MFHLRRGLVGGTLARCWVSWTQTTNSATRVLDISHNGSSADPRTFVGSLTSASRTTAVLGSTSRTGAQVAQTIVDALVADGLTASRDGATVTVQNATNLTVPQNVDTTDTSLRGMWGTQRVDWGDGGAGQILNQNGDAGGTGSIHIGQIGTAGRIIGVYLWTRTDTVASVVRLAASTGSTYSITPGVMTLLAQGTASIQGFGAVVHEAVAFGASDHIWAHYASDTATAGIIYRVHGATPVGRGQHGLNQRLIWDTTRSASSNTAFDATYTPTVNDTFQIYVGIGIVFELPDASGNYAANGRIILRVGDQSDDPDHGTQFPADSSFLTGETTHQRNVILPWTSINVTSVTRTIGSTATGEDCRVALYGWSDTNHPSTTPASLISDLGRMSFVTGTVNRAVTLDLPTPVDISSGTLTRPYYSLGFNYTTTSGAAINTITLPVFVDDVAGDSGWLDCWTDDRRLWHDNIRGASEYAFAAGVQEYRTRVSAGNNGMNTTDADDPWVDPMVTDASDDSPSAIALDWLIIERSGITAT